MHRSRPRQHACRLAQALLSLTALGLLPTIAGASDARAGHAADEPSVATRQEPPFPLEVGVGTAFPIHLGVEVTAHGPWRLAAQLQGGWVPRAYVNALNGTATGLGWYDQATADLIATALSSSFVLRPTLIWRPFADAGGEVFAGYTVAILGGGVSAPETVETVTGRPLPRDDIEEVRLRSVVHAFHAGIAWRLPLGDRWVLRASLAYLQVFASETEITDKHEGPSSRRAALQAAEGILDAYLNDVYTTYVKTAVVALFVTYAL